MRKRTPNEERLLRLEMDRVMQAHHDAWQQEHDERLAQLAAYRQQELAWQETYRLQDEERKEAEKQRKNRCPRCGVCHMNEQFTLIHAMGVLCNGQMALPRNRPFGHEWGNWYRLWPEWMRKLSCLKEEDWPRLILSVEGHLMGEVFNQAVWAKAGFNPRQALLPPRPSNSSKKFPQTGCFRGHEGTYLSFSVGGGVRLLWTLRTRRGKEVYVVDSPEVQACYVFTDEEAAKDWAQGLVDWTEAKGRAKRRIFHAGRWEERISSTLADLGVGQPQTV